MTDMFSPLSIGNLTLKNRFLMAPMENGMAHKGGMVSERLINFFKERARKEVALIVTGSIAVSPEGAGLPSQRMFSSGISLRNREGRLALVRP